MGKGGGGTVAGGTKARLVQQEGDGDQDTAAYDEGQHVGDAVHQVLVGLAADGFIFCRACGYGSIAFQDGSFVVQDLVDQLVGLVDAGGNVGLQDLLASESVKLDLLVCSDDDALGVLYFVSGQDVLGTDGALGLDLDLDVSGGGCLFQGLCCHVGMSDAGRAGCDGQDLESAGLCGVLHLGDLFRQLGDFELVHCIQELFLGLCIAQGLGKFVIHQQDGQTGQDFQVNVVLGVGSCDQEDQIDGLAVQGIIFHALGNGHGCKAGPCYGVGLGVRDGDTVADTCGILCLTGENAFFVAFLVVDVAGGIHQVYHLADGILLVDGAAAQLDAFGLEQISDSHSSLLIKTLCLALLCRDVTYYRAARRASTSGLVARFSEKALAEPVHSPMRKAVL